MSDGAGIHLERTEETRAEVDALAVRLEGLGGGRAGVDALLDDLDRRARRTLAPGRKVHRAWTWDRTDRRDPRWWPQGVTTSADAAPDGRVAGREVVAVAWYAKELPGDPRGGQGSRISVLDLASRRYAHVLLVVPRVQDDRVRPDPLRVHAGGIVWVGDHLHVAATRKGLVTCRLDDLLRVPDAALDETFGYRWVLPVRSTYRAVSADGVEALRYSFASLDRAADPPQLLVGEYGRKRQTTRIVRFPLDPGTGLLATDDARRVRPLDVDERGVRQSQGIAVAGGTSYVTVSRGPTTPGSIMVGSPGAWREHRWAVPMGPEDVAWWPQRDELFTATEHPRRRWVVSVRRSRLR